MVLPEVNTSTFLKQQRVEPYEPGDLSGFSFCSFSITVVSSKFRSESIQSKSFSVTTGNFVNLQLYKLL